jgi:2-phosphoglycerate kinase
MVLEGVHIVPGLLPVELDRALVVQVVVEVRELELHRLNFQVRDAATGGVRGVEKYLGRLDEIRRIQTYVTMRARREQVPVVDNVNVERTVVQILEIILDAAGRSATCRDAPRA